VDLVDNLKPLDLLKHRRWPTVIATDGSEEVESGCDDGFDYDESDCDAEDERWRLLRVRTASFIFTTFTFPYRDCWTFLVEGIPPAHTVLVPSLPTASPDRS
jgi:hypothetical protein